MSQSNLKTIEIACPHQRKIIQALYPCRGDGRYLCRADGTFDLELVECGQDHGRCAETLCALHRFNRRGAGTWYPDQIRAMPERKQTRDRPTAPGDKKNDKNSFDQLC
ncbi:MAG: hypothetical protein QGH60_18675 [Phycisphaerae bacterium]|jgi:hypothetical protein|nr:hypothetical protein [Phycisphaerae bacterium]